MSGECTDTHLERRRRTLSASIPALRSLDRAFLNLTPFTLCEHDELTNNHRLLPAIKTPDYKVPFGEKIVWTFSAGVVLVLGSQMPLFGVQNVGASDAGFALRSVFAGNRGSLFDLGVAPLLASGLLLQTLAASKQLRTLLFGDLSLTIALDWDRREDRALFSAAQKLTAILLAVALSVFSVFIGVYGAVSGITAILLVAQLVVGQILVILIDEAMQQGYGFGSGYGLFIASHLAENMFWSVFSLASFKTGKGTEYEGSIIALVQLVLTRRDKFRALKEAFYRKNLPNLSTAIVQTAVLGAVSYLNGIRMEVPLQHSKMRGAQTHKFPVKLLYSSNYPLLIVSVALGLYSYVSHALFNRFPENMVVRIFGVWKAYDNIAQQFPHGGLAYYLSPPRTLFSCLRDPIQFAIFSTLFIWSATKLSELWTEAAGTNAKDVSKTLESQSLVLPGRREGSIYKELKKLVPELNLAGAAVLAGVALIGDLIGPHGTGTGCAVLITFLYQFFEIIIRENMERPAGDQLF
ncbi:hypothetical protein CcCBS67573_g04752 [Chytriomyces confervae]|uniref:Translocon Sec61/SecY plug domain-containing protein n=1 Tax=Chytriomyces confervae TaxID=246404 RepID=A0A507FF96_9FUNG|nr:hypothetical protein CcCBS67573_g04752 [Chytriomyces confervae]